MNIKQILMVTLALTCATTIYAGNKHAGKEKSPVFIYAGQSNADGRAYMNELPDYITTNKYKHVMYDNVTTVRDGQMALYSPDANNAKYFAFDAVVNYWLDQIYQQPVYAIKCTCGGTALDTLARPAKVPIWYAGEDWLSRHKAFAGHAVTGDNSLAKALIEGVNACISTTISKDKNGYDIKAILWHQGESDRPSSAAKDYEKNFRQLITYLRQHIYEITGDENDKELPFIFGTVPTNSKQYSDEVNKAQRKIASELKNVWFVDLGETPLKNDNLHLNGISQEYLGKSLYNVMVTHQLLPTKKLLPVKKP